MIRSGGRGEGKYRKVNRSWSNGIRTLRSEEDKRDKHKMSDFVKKLLMYWLVAIVCTYKGK